jgi:hypothetical protein
MLFSRIITFYKLIIMTDQHKKMSHLKNTDVTSSILLLARSLKYYNMRITITLNFLIASQLHDNTGEFSQITFYLAF